MAEQANPESSTEVGVSAASSNINDDKVDLLDLLVFFARHKRLVLGLPLITAIVTAIISLLIPFVYTATARMLPPQQSTGAGAVLGQLGGALGGLAGLAGGALGIKNPNDLYVGMLKSRTVADNLIQRFDLNAYYEQKHQSWTRRDLESRTVITPGKDGIITIEVEDKDPKLAAELANAYVDELTKLTKVVAVTEASRRRLFFEHQLAQTKDNLTT